MSSEGMGVCKREAAISMLNLELTVDHSGGMLFGSSFYSPPLPLVTSGFRVHEWLGFSHLLLYKIP